MPEFFALSIVILLFSVIVHEVMHGYAALKFGDHTAERAGRLTLNPIPHIDLFGTIILPAFLIIPPLLAGLKPSFIIGWAKPVPVNPLNFSDIKKGEFFVAAAGVLSNFAIAITSTILYHLLLPLLGPDNLFINLLRFTVTINLLLGVFNFIPIPPLDGSRVLSSLLPFSLAKEYQKLEPYGFLLILVLWFIPTGTGSLLGSIIALGVTFLNTFLSVPLRLF